MNILQVKKYYTFQLEPNDRADQIHIFSFRKSLGKQRKKHVDALVFKPMYWNFKWLDYWQNKRNQAITK